MIKLCACGCNTPLIRQTSTYSPGHWLKANKNKASQMGFKGGILGGKRSHEKNPELGLKIRDSVLKNNPNHHSEVGFKKGNTIGPKTLRKYLQLHPEHQSKAGVIGGKIGGPRSVASQSKRWGPNKLEKDFEINTGIKFNKNIVKVKDGSLVPDFIVGNKCVELFGNYWHKGENPQDRINKFKEVGFDCLVIWESEWYSDKQYWINKVSEFLK